MRLVLALILLSSCTCVDQRIEAYAHNTDLICSMPKAKNCPIVPKGEGVYTRFSLKRWVKGAKELCD